MQYPKSHLQIVSDLTKGRFLLRSIHGQLFLSVYDNKAFYEEFFKQSFGFQLHCSNEYIYLSSPRSQENFSRDVCIFLAILCIELDKEEDNQTLNNIKYNLFDFDLINNFLSNSPFKRNFQNDANCYKDLNQFLRTLNSKNIIEYTDKENDRFRFTKAIDVFFDFARTIAQEKLSKATQKVKS